MFTDYTFVNDRRRTKRIVLDNIKPREVLVEDVKTDIREWYEDKDKNVTGIFPLAHHSFLLSAYTVWKIQSVE